MTASERRDALVAELAAELGRRGLRVQVVPAEPPFQPVPCVNVWRDPLDRMPGDSVYPPYGDGCWTWGPSFGWSRPEKLSVSAIADAVEGTLVG